MPEYAEDFAKSSCLFIFEPVRLNIEAAIKPLTPTAIPIPSIKTCGIANPLFNLLLFLLFSSLKLIIKFSY